MSTQAARTVRSHSNLDPHAARFLADVVRGLSQPVKELPCKYFYDEVGSELFERITQLDEYYPTRTELAIMREHAQEMADLIGPGCLLIEYGSGSSQKTRLLLDRAKDLAAYVPVDVSGDFLRRSVAALAAEYPDLDVRPLCADFTRLLAVPAPRRPAARRVVYFPGSTIGNFQPDEARELLRWTARLCGRGGGLLLGADLRKDPRIIEAAYNDPQGVTAAFNRNVLVRIDRELGGNFDLAQFEHRAFFVPVEGRIEMHLVSLREQVVRVGNFAFSFATDESIRSECSYKYRLADLDDLASSAGFRRRRTWVDANRWFSVSYLTVR